MKKSDIFWQTYMNLEKELIEVSKFIFITDVKTVTINGVEQEEVCNTQLGTFSSHLADLLVRCCVQIEAISKELYYENGGTKPRGDNTIFFDEDCLKLIDIKWQTHSKQVLVVAPFFNLTREENRVLKPLKEAHKRQGTYWERAYQAVKHDRYASLCAGNVKALIQAMAALYLLNLYLRKDTWVVKYQDVQKQDYGMGSSLFSVKAPATNGIWYGNNPVLSESPYVVEYQETDYKRIEEIQKKEEEALNDYLKSQPEMNEEAFISQLQAAFRRSPQSVMGIWELGVYRLNKMIPSTLSFEERKERLIQSDAWNGWINQNNLHLLPEELTSENIQHGIDTAGRRWGMSIMKSIQKGEWLPIAWGSGMCKVYIPEGAEVTANSATDFSNTSSL